MKGLQYIGEEHRQLEQEETARNIIDLQLSLEETSETKLLNDDAMTMQSLEDLQEENVPHERALIHDDQADTLTLEGFSLTQGPTVSSTNDTNCAGTAVSRSEETNVHPGATPQGTSSVFLASLTSASNPSSPLHSTYTSSTSLQSSHVGSPLKEDPTNVHSRSLGLGNQSAGSTSSPIDSLLLAKATPPPSSGPVSTHQPKTQQRQEGPRYPDQSFAALQSQYHPPPYQPHPPQSRYSHPSGTSPYSSGSSMKSRDRSSKGSGARTAGHTPAQSPGLFVATYPKDNATDDDTAESQYSVPLLHPTHLQAPKE